MFSDHEGSISRLASMNQGMKTETEKKIEIRSEKKNGKEEDQLDLKCLTSRYISHALLSKVLGLIASRLNCFQ